MRLSNSLVPGCDHSRIYHGFRIGIVPGAIKRLAWIFLYSFGSNKLLIVTGIEHGNENRWIE